MRLAESLGFPAFKGREHVCLVVCAIGVSACGYPPLAVSGGDADSRDGSVVGDVTVVTKAALFGGSDGSSVRDIDVISVSPDNQIVAVAKTDDRGGTTIEVYPGGSVTAVYRHTVDMGADLITWVGVRPGDTLVFGNRSPSTTRHQNTNLGTQTYTWPVVQDTSFYRVSTACNSDIFIHDTNATSITLSEMSLCHREPMAVAFGAFGSSADGSHVLRAASRSDLAFSNGATVAFTALNMSSTGSINITGLPPDISSVSGMFRAAVDPNLEFQTSGSYSGIPTGGAFSASIRYASIGTRTLGQVTLSRPGRRPMLLIDSFPVSSMTQNVATPMLPPWIQDGAIASSALRTAAWFLASDASSVYDGQLLHMSWNRRISDTSNPYQWHFILPPGQMMVEFPTLPSQFNEFVPAPQDAIFLSISVFDISTISDYDALREQPSANIMCLVCALRVGDFQRVVFTDSS
jgi:hypothetical protein